MFLFICECVSSFRAGIWTRAFRLRARRYYKSEFKDHTTALPLQAKRSQIQCWIL